jgi:hypothetical protein
MVHALAGDVEDVVLTEASESDDRRRAELVGIEHENRQCGVERHAVVDVHEVVRDRQAVVARSPMEELGRGLPSTPRPEGLYPPTRKTSRMAARVASECAERCCEAVNASSYYFPGLVQGEHTASAQVGGGGLACKFHHQKWLPTMRTGVQHLHDTVMAEGDPMFSFSPKSRLDVPHHRTFQEVRAWIHDLDCDGHILFIVPGGPDMSNGALS